MVLVQDKILDLGALVDDAIVFLQLNLVLEDDHLSLTVVGDVLTSLRAISGVHSDGKIPGKNRAKETESPFFRVETHYHDRSVLSYPIGNASFSKLYALCIVLLVSDRFPLVLSHFKSKSQVVSVLMKNLLPHLTDCPRLLSPQSLLLEEYRELCPVVVGPEKSPLWAIWVEVFHHFVKTFRRYVDSLVFFGIGKVAHGIFTFDNGSSVLFIKSCKIAFQLLKFIAI